MSKHDGRYWPIIYVRGYAMTQGEIDQTTADPFCGFNLGSTVLRARPDKNEPARKFMFESPVIRLQSDHGYGDVYQDGIDVVDPEWDKGIPLRSIIIYRYYDEASELLGRGDTPSMEDFAHGLDTLILRIRDRACADNAEVAPADFKCHLVAHSMGGLVCRAFLQNPELGSEAARRCVAKLFTYATPHNGIEIKGLNVPSWLSAADISNFDRTRMAQYLDLETEFAATGRVDWMPEHVLPSSRIFCMVGTNRNDYEAAFGMASSFVGHGSDGLVRIDNASLWGRDAATEQVTPCATAHTYRSHSGYFGIVNSEESYQNLVRFLFGDVRVDVWLDIDEVRVPQELEAADAVGRLDGLYQIEVRTAPRGKRWHLTRRTAEEDSVACRRHADLRDPAKPQARHIYLTTVFLADRYKVVPGRASLAYGLLLGVRVPDYEVDKRFQPNRHYEGQNLFRDYLALEIFPPEKPGGVWKVEYDWESDDIAQASTPVPVDDLHSGRVEVTVPFSSSDATPPRSPGIIGQLRFVVSAWNALAGPQ